MSKSLTLSGIALATVAAGLFAMNTTAIAGMGDKSGDTVKCMGVNACKGKSDCKTAESSCNGKNSCKGHGYVEMSKHACEAVGGKAEQS